MTMNIMQPPDSPSSVASHLEIWRPALLPPGHHCGQHYGAVSHKHNGAPYLLPIESPEEPPPSDNINDEYHRDLYSNRPTTYGKRVRFAEESQNEHYPAAPVTNHSDIWYTLSDLQRFRRNASRYVRDIGRIEKAQSGQAQGLSFRHVLLQVYQACCTPPPPPGTALLDAAQQHNLHMWMAIAPERWGIVRPSVKEIYHDKSSRKKAHVRIVLEVQRMSHLEDVAERAHFVRRAAENISRPSVAFAQVLAEAQATATASWS